MICIITSTSVSILWNISKTQQFIDVSSIRQGDLLSSYILVHYTERLDNVIDKVIVEDH